jgi:hypothetical protein
MSNLNENFKVRNGLTVTSTISAGSCIEGDSFKKHDGTSNQFLKADGSVDSNGYTTCLGTTTHNNTQTFTNKSGSNSQWTNDEGYTCNVGTVTCVSTGPYLTGGAQTSGEIGIDSACASKWDSAATGGVQSFTAGDGLTDSGTATNPNVAVDSTVVRTSGAQSIADIKNFTTSICVGGSILHTGDSDTKINFGTNTMAFCTGNEDHIRLSTQGVTVNEGGLANDFRVESDTDTHALFVDGSADNVGIGTATPGEKLEVVGNVEASGQFIGDLRGAVHFKAEAGEALTKGEAVYISGISGNTTIVSLADANDAAKMPAFGIVTADASSGNPATIANFGGLGTLDTSTFSEGDELYVSTTPGALTDTAPTGQTAQLQKIAKVTRSDSGAGSITIMGAGRSNAVPNLDNGNVFIGNGSNQATTASLEACVCGTGDARYIQGVTTGPYLTGGGLTGCVEVGVDSACAAKWDTAAAGDISAVVAGTNLTGGGTSGSVTLNMATGGIGSGTYGDDATGCKIDTITVDAYGRVTAVACGTTGDITGVTAGNGLSGGATSGTATLALDGSCLAGLNQSACPGINCTGTTTHNNTQTFTNKSGSNSQWTNDAGYTCNTGTVTSVTRGNGINGTGSITSTGSITVGAGTGITVGTNDVSLASACRNALASAYTTTSNLSGCAGLDCTGTTTHNNTQTFTNKSGSNNQWTNDAGYTTCTGTLVPADISGLTCCLGTTTPSNTQTFTNKSGSNSQWTNDEGYTCNVGDITGITAGAGLSGGGTSGTPTIAVDGVLVATLNQSGCAGLDCTGTTTASNSQTFTNKCGNISQWTNNSNFTTCTGTLNPSGTIATNDYAKYDSSGCLVGRSCSEVRSDLGINTAANCTAASLDQSSCAGINCTGTTTASNTQTFTNKSGSNNQWTNDAGYTTCNGDITAVTAGDGITGGATSGSAGIAVDSSVVRTCGDQTINGCKVFSDNTTIQGNLSVIGDFTYLDTFVNVTSALSIVNNGTGPALEVNQTGANDVVNFEDDGTSAFYIENGGNVGINDTNPAHKLDVNGSINTTGSFKIDDSDVINSGKCFVGSGYAGGAITDTYISSASTWNAKTTCTGTVDTSGTPVDNDFAKFTDANTIEGRSCSEVRTDLGIGTAASCTAASLDQSACAGLNCTGTTTHNNTQTFTNKSGNISQWSNDAGYLTAACEGTVTGIDAGTAITVTDGGTATPTVGVTGACNTAWNAKTTCTGTLNPSGTIATNDYAKYNSSGCLVGRSCSEVRSDLGIGTAASCTAASLDQSACAGLNCVGDITGVSVTNGIAGGGTSGSVSLCVDSTVVRTTGNQVIGGTKNFSSTVIVPALSATGTVQANCFAAGAYMEANAPAVEVYPKGTLLALNCDGLIVQSTQEESSMVFGVATGDDQAPIVMGAEPICVTGCITVGDFITSSSCNGHGKKAICPEFGTVIAQAMESGGGDSYKIKAMIRKI